MFIRELLQSILRTPGQFAEIASHDPLSAVLLAIGAVITLATVGFFGFLVLGSVADLLTPSPAQPPQQLDR